MSKKLVMCLALMLCLVSVGYASDPFVIGSWEGVSDGWIDWGNTEAIDSAANMPSKYQYSDLWSSDGDYSLRLEKQGWQQNLAIKLQNQGFVDEFMARNTFSIDLMAPADDLGVGGWEEIYTVSLNAEGYGWNDLGDKPAVHVDFWAGSPMRVFTVTWDYTAAKASMPVAPNWVEFIIATNGGDTNRDVFYLDNARLDVPEPATMALLGLGALALLRRKH